MRVQRLNSGRSSSSPASARHLTTKRALSLGTLSPATHAWIRGEGRKGGRVSAPATVAGDPMGAKRRPAAVRRWIGRRRGGGGFGAYLGDVKAQVSIGGRHEGRPLVGLDFEAPECHSVAREVSCRKRRRRRKMAKRRPRKASSARHAGGGRSARGHSPGPSWKRRSSNRICARHNPRRVTDRDDGCTASGRGRDRGGADAPSATRDGDARRSHRRRAPSGVPRLDHRRLSRTRHRAPSPRPRPTGGGVPARAPQPLDDPIRGPPPRRDPLRHLGPSLVRGASSRPPDPVPPPRWAPNNPPHRSRARSRPLSPP